VVAVNKLDLVDWSQERYDFIFSKVLPFLKQIGFREDNIAFVPISGFFGVNLCSKPTAEEAQTLVSWY
jgi:translation elongation factor EF-1alpha